MGFFKKLFGGEKPSRHKRQFYTKFPEGWPELDLPNVTGKLRVDGVLTWGQLTGNHNWVSEPDEDFYVKKLTEEGAILIPMVFRIPGDDRRHPLFVLYTDEHLDENMFGMHAKYFPYYEQVFANEPGWGPAAYLGTVPPEELPWDAPEKPDSIGFVDLFQFDEKDELPDTLFTVWQRHPQEEIWGGLSIAPISKSYELLDGFEIYLANLLFKDWMGKEDNQLDALPDEAYSLLLRGPENYPVVAQIGGEPGIAFLTPHTAPPHYRRRIYQQFVEMLEEFHNMYQGKIQPLKQEGKTSPWEWWQNWNKLGHQQIYLDFVSGFARDGVKPEDHIPALSFDPLAAEPGQVVPRVLISSGEAFSGENPAPHYHLAGNLYVVYSVDRPGHFQNLLMDHFHQLGEPSPEQLYELALANQKRLLGEISYQLRQLEKLPVGIVGYHLDWLANLLLIHEAWNSLDEKIGGDLCICLPYNQFLAYGKWTNADAREELLKISEQALLHHFGGDQAAVDAVAAVRLQLYKWTGLGWELLQV